ncbi:RNA polymerase subunit sigma-70 [Tsukamurella paurometabola]|uniref:RNA polymerase sigma factor sigX n=1 Tax=Tsukamurella paurometabola TaxID=2061 RepID=A0A3P8L881_TSUPA|nr:RNA polymerase subunit sigma-70 [Tsukamurella paurometabola]MBS4101004.1 RNA polymerase subunit sigma-70 [Tsukamurella paurometabola]UEA82865.1 RNA polymerase subunit sigma-70 [Tsukamurella paurometabola]VDR39941.1 RNA polymerase sigma factor sigX [Tsukamurella paurometabola]
MAVIDAAIDEDVLGELRPELVRYCYRMIGDGAGAEDAAQEVLLRLWRSREGYDPARASIRTWAYAIASRYCIDLLRAAPRKALPTDLSERNGPGDQALAQLRPGAWVTPLPDAGGDPAAAAERHESIRMAFVAALQRLTPSQRAVLVLRDVYRHSAAETAAILGISATAVHSALQRARKALASAGPPPSDLPAGEVDPRLLDGFVRAFERHDVAGLAALLAEDVVFSMPPVAFWLRGAVDYATLFGSGDACVGHRLVPTTANGAPAFGQYAPDSGGAMRPFALVVVESDGARITRVTTCLDQADRFEAFGLPAHLTAD